MTRKENINNNIDLSFDFMKKVVDNPALLDKIPNGANIEFVRKDFSPKTKKEKQPTRQLSKKFVRVKNDFEII